MYILSIEDEIHLKIAESKLRMAAKESNGVRK